MISKKYYKNKDHCKVTFSVTHDQINTVDVCGLNNDWSSPLSLQKGKNGIFATSVLLPKESIHEFRYLIDKSVWANDSSADGEVPNPYGTTNSVLSL